MSDGAGAPAAPPPGFALDPVSGEVVELGLRDSEHLAEFRDRLGELKRVIDATLVEVDSELTTRLDLDNRRSSRFGGFEVKTEAPLATVWDVGHLGLELEALVQAGKLSRAAAAAALKQPEPEPPKPVAAELKKLLAHADPDVVDAVEACRHAVPRQRRRVTVKQTAPAQRRLSRAQGPQEGKA